MLIHYLLFYYFIYIYTTRNVKLRRNFHKIALLNYKNCNSLR
jgi:hypothetical protein